MPTNTTAYSVGDNIRLGLVVKSTAGTNTNTGVTLIINSPSTVEVYGPVTSTNSTVLDHTTTGTWRKTISLTRAGRWTYRWESTGAVVTSTEGAFAVYPQKASS